jgi:hypothetical protein
MRPLRRLRGLSKRRAHQEGSALALPSRDEDRCAAATRFRLAPEIRSNRCQNAMHGSTFGRNGGTEMYENGPIDVPAQAAGPLTATAGESRIDARPANIVPSFLAELARAMQAAAERERGRIAEIVAEDAAENVEKTRTRADAETEELRRLAETDLERIQDWAATETERIRREAERRTEGRRNDLAAYLAQHDSIIAIEIDGVDAAVRGYRAALDQFFDELSASTDPTEIVRRAGSLPPPPDLDDVRATARAGAVEQLANASQDATDDPVGDEVGSAVVADPVAPAEADAGNESSAEAGVGMGVMDPDSPGRSEDSPVAPDEVEAEPAIDWTAAPPADPEDISVDQSAEEVDIELGQSEDRSSAAVRLLRSIAPWTSPAGDDAQDLDSHTN